MNHSAEELFARWVEAPIKALRTLDNGDGAFAALAISLGLYERFIKSVLNKRGEDGTPENFRKEAAADLKITPEVAGRFWDGYRLGVMHAFQPKNYVQNEGKGDAWGWSIAEGVGYEAFPTVEKRGDKLFILRLDPWAFTEHVLALWRANPEMMNQLSVFAFGKIERIEPKAPPVATDPTTFRLTPENFRTYSEPQPQPPPPPATGQWPGARGDKS